MAMETLSAFSASHFSALAAVDGCWLTALLLLAAADDMALGVGCLLVLQHNAQSLLAQFLLQLVEQMLTMPGELAARDIAPARASPERSPQQLWTVLGSHASLPAADHLLLGLAASHGLCCACGCWVHR